MGTLQSWRKAYGAIKDTTTVSLANLNSDYKDLDVAIVKATNHVECPPKERHVRKILAATSITRPRADVAYCMHALARRLSKTHNWTVALKALIVIHRNLREGDPIFREELLNFSQRGRILQLSNFKDDSSPIAWDCSAWVRTYAIFLEERLECFKTLKYDIEAEPLKRPVQAAEGHSTIRELNMDVLLDQLPALQQLLYRLIGCRPEGAALNNYVIQYALALVLKESFKIYCAINDGIINLVDKFFEMPRHEAIRALEIYRRAGQQAGSLSDFYEVCRGLELARNFQFPNLREPPQSFLTTMDDYIREAPRVVPVSRDPLDIPEKLLLTYKQEDIVSAEGGQPSTDESFPGLSEEVSLDEPLPAALKGEEVLSSAHTAENEDLLGLGMLNPDASKIEENNALALSIIPTSSATSLDTVSLQGKEFSTSGWELALVSAPTSSSSFAVESQLAGGFDKLILNSLYDDATYRHAASSSSNPFLTADPFSASESVAPAPAVQMASMTQQQLHLPIFISDQQHVQQQYSNPFTQPMHMTATYPFDIQVAHDPHLHNNPFGLGQLL